MATNKELEKRLEQLEQQNQALRNLIPELREQQDAVDITERADYVPHGSKAHATFLGLIEVTDEELEDAKNNEYILYESPTSGKRWRLEDEISPFTSFPNPDKMAKLTLRQKVSELESGKPVVPDYAPPLLVPESAF